MRQDIQHEHQSSKISWSEMISSIGRTSSPLESTRGNDKSNSLTDAAVLGIGLITVASRVDNPRSNSGHTGTRWSSAETNLRDFLAGFSTSNFFSKSSRRKSGSDVISTESLLRSGAAPSRKAWAVFSWALLVSTSFQYPLAWSFSRNLPGGLSCVRTCSTMLLVIDIFSVLVLVAYSLCDMLLHWC